MRMGNQQNALYSHEKVLSHSNKRNKRSANGDSLHPVSNDIFVGTEDVNTPPIALGVMENQRVPMSFHNKLASNNPHMNFSPFSNLILNEGEDNSPSDDDILGANIEEDLRCPTTCLTIEQNHHLCASGRMH